MSIQVMEGFDGYGSSGTNFTAELASSICASCSLATVNADTRTGIGTSAVLQSARFYTSSTGKAYVGFAAKFTPSNITPAAALVQFNCDRGLGAGSEYRNLLLFWNDLGQLVLYAGAYAPSDGNVYPTVNAGNHITHDAPSAVSPARLVIGGNWHYIEVSQEPTRVQVRVDGSVVIDYTIAGGTICPGSANTNIIELGPNILDLGGQAIFDDFYVLDDSTAYMNAFQGDVSIVTCAPTSDAGPNQMTKVGGVTSHASTQTDTPADGDTSYVTSNTHGDTEMYDIADLPGSALSVLAMGVQVRARKDATGYATMQIRAKVGSSLAQSSGLALGANYATQQFFLPKQPNGADWTVSDANNAQIGFNLV